MYFFKQKYNPCVFRSALLNSQIINRSYGK